METPPRLRIIVGLGNPGAEYRGNRHNVGFMAVERIAGPGPFERRGPCLVHERAIAGVEALLVKPQTFMNRSGEAVRSILEESGAGRESLLVVYDDVEIPFGSLRVRERGSAGGHNGMKSIIDTLESTDFARLRIGVGRSVDPGALADHVLEDFGPDESTKLPAILDAAGDAVELCLEGRIGKAMSLYNRRDLTGAPGGGVPGTRRGGVAEVDAEDPAGR